MDSNKGLYNLYDAAESRFVEKQKWTKIVCNIYNEVCLSYPPVVREQV